MFDPLSVLKPAYVAQDGWIEFSYIRARFKVFFSMGELLSAGIESNPVRFSVTKRYQDAGCSITEETDCIYVDTRIFELTKLMEYITIKKFTKTLICVDGELKEKYENILKENEALKGELKKIDDESDKNSRNTAWIDTAKACFTLAFDFAKDFYVHQKVVQQSEKTEGQSRPKDLIVDQVKVKMASLKFESAPVTTVMRAFKESIPKELKLPRGRKTKGK